MFTLDCQLTTKVLQGCLHGDNVAVQGVAIDSRQVQPGQLFFAIPGERVDPHAYLSEVKAAGAAAAVVQYYQDDVALPQIVVDDSFKALGVLAKYWRNQFYLPIIGLTGSNGKTTLKNLVASILLAAHQYDDSQVLANHGNLNSGFGLPLTLLRLSSSHQVAVCEMGMSSFGEIDYISRLARPQVAVINNVYPAHVEQLGSLENIAKAKAEIFNGIESQGVAVLNRDDQFYDYWCDIVSKHVMISFGLNPQATIYASDISDNAFPHFQLHTPVGNRQVQMNLLGKHNVKNALAAAATTYALGIPLDDIVAGLEQAQAEPGRLRQIKLSESITLLDDAYNSNPGSLQAGIDVLAKYSGQRILVMGDMRELGDNAVEMHQQMAYYAADAGVDKLLALGPLSIEAVDVFRGNAQHFDDHDSLLAAVKSLLHDNTTVLVKGSNSIGLSRIVTALEAEFSRQRAQAELF